MTLWFSPVCDQALIKLLAWRRYYETGEVHSTCKFNDPRLGVIDKPTRYMHRLIWDPKQWEHIVRIMKDASGNKALIEELELIQKVVIPRGQLVVGGHRMVSLAFYPEHIDEMITAMQQAKNGKAGKTVAEEIKDGGLF